MAIIEPEKYEPEEIVRIPLPGPDECYVISGFADFTYTDHYRTKAPAVYDEPSGSDYGDDLWVTNTLYLIVGREWLDIKAVSPTAAIAGYFFRDSDETDDTGIELENCRWDTVGVEGNSSLEKIRLKIKLRMCGGWQSTVTKISYHLVAIVTEVGATG